jgi:acyl-CoA reductase-like NAD-dependent aldehyde dehydrogenase
VGATLEVLEPATEQVLDTIPRAGAQDVDDAVARAKAAFPAWRGGGPPPPPPRPQIRPKYDSNR